MLLYDVEMYASVFLYGDCLDDARMLYAYRQAVSEAIKETRGDAARFSASAQAQIIICILLSSMPISIRHTGAYSPSSVQGMQLSLPP